MFHSTGMPLGVVDPDEAVEAHHDAQHQHRDERRDVGREHERDRPLGQRAHARHEDGELPWPQVFRVVGEQPALEPLREERPVVHHHLDHGREVVVDLRRRRPEPDEAPDELAERGPRAVASQCHCDARERDPVVLGARGEKQRLVRQAHHRNQDHAREQQRRRELGSDQRAEQEQLVRGVERHVEPGALDPAE
jgi:hypothetical protein